VKVIAKSGREDLATVYIAENENGKRFEFVESIQPPFTKEEKWVSIISTLYGCPVSCPMCDAGRYYDGKIEKDELLAQIDYLVKIKFGSRTVPSKQWKIQFARMGDPVLNPDVLEVLKILPDRYQAPGLMPSISTVAPKGCGKFLNKLIKIRDEYYPNSFQMQFSLHTTNETKRSEIIPVRTWSMAEMGEWGQKFYREGQRRIALNFAVMKGVEIDSSLLRKHFDPTMFIIKITPLNPTFSVRQNNLESMFNNKRDARIIADRLKSEGFDVIVSIGELEENAIGSNCGQYITSMERSGSEASEIYSFPLISSQRD